MSNTALGAKIGQAQFEKERITNTITFNSKEHEQFYFEHLPKCRYTDVYHKALVYTLGISRDTREHVNSIYDFKTQPRS